MRVLVCGSRDWTDTETIQLTLSRLPLTAEVIHGDALGADNLAASYAMLRGHPVRAFPADWRGKGKRAGIIRNLAMLDEKPDLVIAFWDGKSPGTRHTITEAGRRGIRVEVISA